MINVYWGNEYIDPILDIFRDNNIKTTLFIGGSWAAKNTELLEKIFKDGHEIGNHGYNHKDHKSLSETSNKEEIYACNNLIKQLIGVDVSLFSPPSGSYSSITLSVANSLGLKTIMWTRDTIDWRDQNSALICSRALKNIQGGDLILMHPTAETLKALPDIINGIKSQGLLINTVTNTIS